MGFDLYGIKAISKKGEYFRNNVWWWRPLWVYVCEACSDILTEEDMNAGHFNDGYKIDAEKSRRIAARLGALIKEKKVLQYSDEYNSELESLPDEKCDLCKSTGERHDKYVDGQCNVCAGRGKVRPSDTWYPFKVENIKEFAKFCRASGGFEIC